MVPLCTETVSRFANPSVDCVAAATAELFARMSTRYTRHLHTRGSVRRVDAARRTCMVVTPDFGDVIADLMLAAHEALAARWFERLVDLLPVDERNVFPSNSLLDHVPALIREISESLRLGGDAAMAANTSILDKARELGALRHQQRASLHQVLREYQILGGVLVQFVLEEVERLSTVPSASACVFVVSRIHHAVDVLSQTTVETFVSLYTRTISEQT